MHLVALRFANSHATNLLLLASLVYREGQAVQVTQGEMANQDVQYV